MRVGKFRLLPAAFVRFVTSHHAGPACILGMDLTGAATSRCAVQTSSSTSRCAGCRSAFRLTRIVRPARRVPLPCGIPA
jgi:hypothetical protein